MNFKKLTTLAMIAILSTSLVACSSKGEGESTKNKEVTVGV